LGDCFQKKAMEFLREEYERDANSTKMRKEEDERTPNFEERKRENSRHYSNW